MIKIAVRLTPAWNRVAQVMVVFGLLVAGMNFQQTAHAQAVSVNGGSIQGTITDTSGAVVSNATVTVTGTDTGYSKVLTTDSRGFYSLGPLNPGRYSIDVVGTGFQTLKAQTVISTGTATNGNYKLQVGSSAETVEVTAGDVQVNTDQPGVTGVITTNQLNTLPVGGRNILDFAQLQPGVQLQAGGYADGGFDPTKAGYSALSFSGISGRTTRILLDGQDVTDETVGTTIFNISQGSVGEIEVSRATADASTDITSSGSVLMSTRAGTNAYHGELFYIFQDARAGAATYEGIESPFQRNQFGGSAGGPILKDKLFFFGNVERFKQDQQSGIALGPLFSAIQSQFPGVGSPNRDTYSTLRFDYNGPWSTHFFVRGNYEANSFNTGSVYSTYANRDNAPGIAGGADFVTGRFTHSFRGSYEKFHNLIGDTTTGNSSLYNPIPGFGIEDGAQGLQTGPNDNAPQQTFQTDKQLRYDGSWTKGAHNVRFGANVNRILGGGLAAFFGNGPLADENSSTVLANCNNTPGAAPCPADPIHGYSPYYVYISNNQGYASEKPGFGLPGGFQGDWRTGVYIADSWKVRPTFTLSFAARYQRDTGRTNSDLAPIPCSALVTSNFNFASGAPPCSGNSQLLDLWGSGLGGRVSQPNKNIGPQIGFAYNPAASPKTVFRGGIGIYFESNVFNNVQFDRASRLAQGRFASYPYVCLGNYTYPVPGVGSVSANSNGVTIQQMCSESIATAAPQLLQLQTDVRAAGTGNIPNTSFAGYGLAIENGSIAFSPKYRSPYSININFGVQRELASGVVLSADYVHLATLHFQQTMDANHVGDASYLDTAAGQSAIAATLAGCGVSSVDEAIIACPGLHTDPTSGIVSGATIQDFASNGLDSGVSLNGGYPASYAGTQAAFAGVNPNVGVGTFSLPQGKSYYDGLQMNLREQKSHPLPYVDQSNLEVSYAYSRFITTGGVGGTGSTSDQFFSPPSYNNRNPTQDLGWGNLDRRHILSLGGAITAKYGPRIGLIAHFESAPPTNLNLDTQGGGPGEIFSSDVNGDGQTGDLVPGTNPGAYMRQYGPDSLNKLITNYNATNAGQLTPAGKAVVAAGLLTANQLSALGGVQRQLAPAPAHAFPNSPLRTVDANFAYPIRLYRLHEGLSLEPTVSIYNVMNLGNFGGPTGTILTDADVANGNGDVNGSYDYPTKNGARVGRKTGTFAQGAPRTTEFQLKFNF